MAKTVRTRLRQSLGLFQLSIYGIGTIIGAGIYSVIAPAAAEAGDAIWIGFLLAAGISALSALSYAEIASALPGAGGEHHFLRETFPRLPALAFIVGLFISVHGAAVLATVALTFGNYFETVSGLAPELTAIALMLLMTGINIAGMSGASKLNAALTILQVLCLLAFAATALSGSGAAERLAPKLAMPSEWSGVLASTAIVFFIYTGYEHMASLSEEAERPDRDLWKAFLIALSLTSVIYLLIVFAVLAVVDTAALAGSGAPLAFAAAETGAVLGIVILAAALLATANAVLSASLSGSRMLFGMAREGDLPAFLVNTFGSEKSPWAAALLFLGIAAIFALMGEIDLAASLSSLGALLVFIAVNTAVIVLRYTRPGLKRPFRLVSIGQFPVTAALGVVASLAIAAQYEMRVYLIFAAAVAAGLTAYFTVRRGR